MSIGEFSRSITEKGVLTNKEFKEHCNSWRDLIGKSQLNRCEIIDITCLFDRSIEYYSSIKDISTEKEKNGRRYGIEEKKKLLRMRIKEQVDKFLEMIKIESNIKYLPRIAELYRKQLLKVKEAINLINDIDNDNENSNSSYTYSESLGKIDACMRRQEQHFKEMVSLPSLDSKPDASGWYPPYASDDFS